MKKYPELCLQLIAAGLFMQYLPAKAQIIINSASLSYHQNFNTLDSDGGNSSNLPYGWQIFEYGTSTTTVNNQYKGNSGSATTGDTYSYGSAGSNDRALGSLSTSGNRECYGAIFKNNTGTAIISVVITYRGEQWRRGNCTSDTLLFRYSTTASAIADTNSSNWNLFPQLSLTSIYPGTIVNTALDGNTTENHTDISDTLMVNVPPGDSLLIAWADREVSGSDDGLAIDDLTMTFITDGPAIPEHIYTTSKSPEGDDIDPATHELKISFDHAIEAGSGLMLLHKAGGSTPLVITIPSAQVTVNDSAATIADILLENNSSYYVLITEGTFKMAGNNITNMAIADTTVWIFSTADTVVIRPLTALDESFQHCTDTAMGLFKQYNTEGFKTWRCSNTGHNGDSAAVSMSGGVTDGISDNNMDWLISRLAFDFSAMSKPELSFRHKKRFTGNVNRTVKISTDYITGSNPATASWITLPVQDMTDDPSEDWMPIADIDLSPYKNMPFFLAFTYSCGENGAYELSYDDIKVDDEALNILTPKHDKLTLQVMGTPTSRNINIAISSPKESDIRLSLFDLNGKRTLEKQVKVSSGKGVYQINDSGLLPGLYLLKAICRDGHAVVKLSVAGTN